MGWNLRANTDWARLVGDLTLFARDIHKDDLKKSYQKEEEGEEDWNLRCVLNDC